MNRVVIWLIGALVMLSLLTAAGPAVVGLAHAAVPLVIALGCVVIALRLTWYFTNRY